MVYPGNPLDGWKWRCPCGTRSQHAYGRCLNCRHHSQCISQHHKTSRISAPRRPFAEALRRLINRTPFRTTTTRGK